MHSDIDVSADDGVALVSVRVDNDAPVDRRVRLRNRLDGPVLPPRRAGVPEPGWDDEGFEGVVPAGSTVALGYAVPLSPPGDRDAEAVDADSLPEHAVDVETLGRADESDEAADSTPEGAIRSLGSARPPADAVPVSADPSPTVSAPETPESAPDTAGDERSTPSEQPTDADVSAAVEPREPRDHETQRPSEPASLAAVERRIDLAERLDGASVADAAAALSETERGVDALESLDADRERLRRLAARATALADRAADADPDVDALRRLA
ncbi:MULTISPECIES: hypothetical protein [unclassified Haloferax]|uniref:DUF7857 domain-containing protein n=1 Tax=unclassified Haloferax TaxID=2625095 RepID=UPI0002B004B2|nr:MULTISPECIES: hypothetical protein [unclassified Haloferax]ELZ57901.1 hypothetical protein C460_11403 [Haloferax sp. ATCC BAA-646]ELZ62386.1 hypothetical protein C459_12784 [Haloferax sp. ATCC BAA-645]ELZ64127.1 hypothetical protein C458_14902 [Haloferax sp. ATCC BAA-644]